MPEPRRSESADYVRQLELALEFYASDTSYDAGIAGHAPEDDPDGWVPDLGHRAAVVLHGNPFPTDAEVEEAESDG